MENFENNQESADGEEKRFDPNDPWDRYVVKIGKNFHRQEKEQPSDENCFQDGISWKAGGQFVDGFGSWNPGQGEWVLKKPEKIADFDEKLINGTYQVQVDTAAVGQPDGPDTAGHIWTARLWDQKADEEIKGSRVFGNKLSHAVTAALEHMPEWGKTEWKPTEEERGFIEKRDEQRILNETADAVDYHWANSEKSPHKEQIQTILKKEFPIIAQIIANGGAKKWLNESFSKDTSAADMATEEQRMSDFCGIAYSLNEYFKDPDGWERAYPDDLIFRNSLVERKGGGAGSNYDESDGWMPPPNWRG